MIRIITADLDDPRVIEMLDGHVRRAAAETAPGSAHALDVSGLRGPSISVWAAWDGDALLGLGALKLLSRDHGEVKSMHTAEVARRRGVGRAMLAHIVETARARKLKRLSLETGSWDYFKPAHALYRGFGFVDREPFGDYRPDRNSLFLTLELCAGP